MILHFTYGLLSALVLGEIVLLGYRRLPFASSYVPAVNFTTYGSVYALVVLDWRVHAGMAGEPGAGHPQAVLSFCLSSRQQSGQSSAESDVWQRRERLEIELDELVDPPTLRLGLME